MLKGNRWLLTLPTWWVTIRAKPTTNDAAVHIAPKWPSCFSNYIEKTVLKLGKPSRAKYANYLNKKEILHPDMGDIPIIFQIGTDFKKTSRCLHQFNPKFPQAQLRTMGPLLLTFSGADDVWRHVIIKNEDGQQTCLAVYQIGKQSLCPSSPCGYLLEGSAHNKRVQLFSWQSKGTPPMPPARNKALLRDY